jgi:protein ImuB
LSVTPENLDAEFGFEAMRLDAVEIAPILLRPSDLASASMCDPAAKARLIDTLTARLGAERIGRLGVSETHAPERTTIWADTSQANGTIASAPDDGVMRRPLTLFARAQPIEAMASVPDGPPVRFRWRRVLREVARAEGPERIAPNWLRAPHARTRDYYRVEDRQGRRYWLYREGFYDKGEPPRWYLHGLFA